MTNKELAETIHNAVWSANNNHTIPFDPSTPPDLFDRVIMLGIGILMAYSLVMGG